MEEYKFPHDPIANPESVISGKHFRISVLDQRVLRLEWAHDGEFEDRPSTFAHFRKFPKPDFRVEDKSDRLEIITSLYRLSYDRQRFSPNGLTVTFSDKHTEHGGQWRFGEGDGGNLGGTARTLDGVDGRCDMGTGIISRSGYAVIDDSKTMLFDENSFVTPRKPGDRIDVYLFGYALDYKGAMESFYAISGRQPTVPRWCLGNWWSRYYAYTQQEYLDLMQEFKDNDIPLSVAVIDMDWHWVKEPFVPHTGWTGYSWNTNLFPDPVEFARQLHKMNLRTTLNDHPHSGVYHHEDVYEELAKVLGFDTSHQDPIEFDPTSQAYMHAFFNVVHRRLEKQGCDFWWIDWQQGENSRIPGFDPLWLLNHYQYLDTKKYSPESLPIIFSRYAGPGSHRYPVGFSGDTFATWASLQFQPEFTATASNIGFGWWSHDIGGHLPGERDDECTTRWVQCGVFSPLMRLHSTVSQWMSKEPWLYRSEHKLAIEKIMRFRHRLVPYLYSLNAANLPVPLIQPLYWSFPQREEAYSFPNEYYLGPSMLVSPIVTPRDPRTNLAEVKMWLPPQRHVDLFTGTVYDGDREIELYRALDEVPVLLPSGSIIPLDSDEVPPNGCINPKALEVLLVVGADGKFEVIEDSRDDHAYNASKHDAKQRSFAITYTQSTGRISFTGGEKSWKVRLVSADVDPKKTKISVNGAPPANEAVSCIAGPGVLGSWEVSFPSILGTSDHVVIDLGPDPQLAVVDHSRRLKEMLRDFQMPFRTKDKLWSILESSQPTAAKIGRILALGLDRPVFGPLLELLLADTRGK